MSGTVWVLTEDEDNYNCCTCSEKKNILAVFYSEAKAIAYVEALWEITKEYRKGHLPWQAYYDIEEVTSNPAPPHEGHK